MYEPEDYEREIYGERGRDHLAQSDWLPWALAILTVGLALLVILFTGDSDAHEAPKGWNYPWACCSNRDCQQVSSGKASFLSEEPDGYRINSTGEVVPYRDKRVKDSPDGEYHWCAHPSGLDAGHTICLFVPPKGF